MSHWVYHFIVFIIFLKISFVKADLKYNVSLAQLQTCRQYNIPNNRDYEYEDFFHVKNLKNNKLSETELLHLKFYVTTAKDAHILLAVSNHPELRAHVYEIVIGAGSNSFSTIRTSIGDQSMDVNDEPNILSMHHPTPIEVIQTKDANLLVYIPGYKEEPFLSFTDTSPLNISYISFSTYEFTPANWFYDCQFDGFSDELEEDIRPLTPHQLLLKNITAKAENGSVPPYLRNVNFSFDIAAIRYQHDHGFFQTRLKLVLNWQDHRIKWKPEDFNFIHTIQYRKYEIWTPRLIIINGAGKTYGISDLYQEIKIENNGSVTMIFPDAILTTWCVNPEQNWPNEHLKCDIDFGLESGPLDVLPLIYKDKLVHDTIDSLSEWHLHKISVNPVNKGIMTRFTHDNKIQSMVGDVSVVFEISRNGGFYKKVFSVPILACQALIVLSFLLSGYRRGALILVVTVILMLGLMFITKHAPTPYVPDLMLAYQRILRVATFCYILHIVILCLELHPPKAKPYPWLTALLNRWPLRLLRSLRLARSNQYVGMEQHPWKEIGKVLNVFCFLCINLVLIITIVFYLPQA